MKHLNMCIWSQRQPIYRSIVGHLRIYQQLPMRWSRGSPFNNEGAGRNKTSRGNEQRIQQILNNFQSSPQGAILATKQHQMTITKAQANRNLFLCPTLGFLIGLAGSYSFVHPSSKYIGKLFILLTTLMGYKQYLISYEDYQFSRRVGMFPYYPKEIQQMLDNNDFRYARKWLSVKPENPEAAQKK